MQLIINADDFGMTKGVNKAILHLLSIGSLSSTSVMTNMPHYEEVEELNKIPGIGIGLHFNLTQGMPVADIDSIPTLVNSKGEFMGFEQFVKNCRRGRVNREDVLKELQAQFVRLSKITNRPIDHINTHQSIHKQSIIHEAFRHFSKFIPVCGVRVPILYTVNETGKIRRYRRGKTLPIRVLKELIFDRQAKSLRKDFTTVRGELHHSSLKRIDFLNWLSEYTGDIDDNGTYEVPCHPAQDLEGLQPTKLLEKRLVEYSIMSSREFSSSIENFSLTTYLQQA